MVKARAISARQVREMISQALAGGAGGQVLHRLDAVLLVAEAMPCQHVAELFGVNRRTIERWVSAFDSGGPSALNRPHLRAGRPGKLSAEQCLSIKRDLQSSPGECGYPDRTWCGKRLARHVAQRHAVTLSERTCQRLIARAKRERTLPAPPRAPCDSGIDALATRAKPPSTTAGARHRRV